MNASGRISGDSRLADPTQRYGYVWQLEPLVNGKLTLLPFLARFTIGEVGTDVRTAARGINDAGYVTGFTVSGGSQVGFVGNDAKGFLPLVPPGSDLAGALPACTGINNARKVVCVVTDASGNNLHRLTGGMSHRCAGRRRTGEPGTSAWATMACPRVSGNERRPFDRIKQCGSARGPERLPRWIRRFVRSWIFRTNEASSRKQGNARVLSVWRGGPHAGWPL